MGGRRVRCRRTGLRSRTCSTCLQTSAGVECSLTPKGDLRANQGVMAMSREGASAPSWRYRSGSQKLTMSTSRTAERPPSVAPAIANRRTSLSLAEVAPARQGGFGSSGSDPFCVKKTQPVLILLYAAGRPSDTSTKHRNSTQSGHRQPHMHSRPRSGCHSGSWTRPSRAAELCKQVHGPSQKIPKGRLYTSCE